MTLYQFNLLNKEQQSNYIRNGVFLVARENGIFKILLFQVFDFYVEAFYSKEPNELKRIRPLTRKIIHERYFGFVDRSVLN
jgi:hypothetical protein